MSQSPTPEQIEEGLRSDRVASRQEQTIKTLREQRLKLDRRILNQHSEIKNRLLQIHGMERENAWLRGIKKRVRTALGLDSETLQTAGISDPADAAKRICSERDELRSENHALRERNAELEWRPIETAPKDGTPLLLCATGADGRPLIVIASWGCRAHCFSSIPVCPSPECRFRWLGEMGIKYGVDFTHWMPLPAPPGLGAFRAKPEVVCPHCDELRSQRDRALSELAECQPIIEAARKIHHWHDTDNGGMVVSEEAVHTLWDALLSYDDGKETARPAPEVIARAAIPENGATEAK